MIHIYIYIYIYTTYNIYIIYITWEAPPPLDKTYICVRFPRPQWMASL